MRTYLLTIICPGMARRELRAAANGCAAICGALQRWPQARSISARPMPFALQEAANG